MKWILLIGLVFSHWAGSENKKPLWKTGKTKVKIQPQYESCKEVNLSSLDLEENGSRKDTTAKFCFSCSIKEVFGFRELKETSQTLQSKTFMDKLRKRVIGQIESKIFQTKALRACATGDRNWLSQQKVDWSLMKAVCKQKNKQLKSSIKIRWTEMRVNLALSQVNPDQIVTGNPYLSFPLSHAISDFSSLPKLTKKEQKTIKKRWVNRLTKTPLDKLTPSEFKAHFLKGEPSKLSARDRRNLRKSTWKMQKEAKDAYFEITSEMPLLGYLKTGNPNKKELDEAFTKMEENLKDLLKEARDLESDEGLFLSFKPLVEELLREDKGYCLVAEKARIKAEKNESFKNWKMLGAGVLATAPCFIAGPVGASICLTTGVGLGVVGYKEAQSATKKSLGRVLMGKQFETMAGLNEKEKEEFLAKLFLPLGAWGTTAVPARAASGAVAKVVKRAKTQTGKRTELPQKSLAERRQLGEKSLERRLNQKETEALERAHHVGMGEKGKDGTSARIGNYTQAQLREKNKILKQAGFSKIEREKLIKDGVVGNKTMEAQATIDKPQRVDKSRTADQRQANREFWQRAEERKAQKLYEIEKQYDIKFEVVEYNGPPLRFIDEEKASVSLGKTLNEEQLSAIEDAHLSGWGKKGKDGTPARIGNYTEAQLREKARILKVAGFSKAEIRKLMEDGVVGYKGLTAAEMFETFGFKKMEKITQTEGLLRHLLDEVYVKEGHLSQSKVSQMEQDVLALYNKTQNYQYKQFIDEVLFDSMKEGKKTSQALLETLLTAPKEAWEEVRNLNLDWFDNTMVTLTNPGVPDRYLKIALDKKDWINLGRLLENPEIAKRVIKKTNEFNSSYIRNSSYSFSEFAQKLSDYVDEMTTEQVENFMKAADSLIKDKNYRVSMNSDSVSSVMHKLAKTLQGRDDVSPEMGDRINYYFNPGKGESRRTHTSNINTESSVHHNILGVSPDASQEQIKKAYQKAAMKWHPDRRPDDPTAAEKFKKIKAAYEALKDSN